MQGRSQCPIPTWLRLVTLTPIPICVREAQFTHLIRWGCATVTHPLSSRTTYFTHPGVRHSDLPPPPMAIESVKGRKPISDPCLGKTGPDEGRKPTSNPCHSKTDPVKGMKCTSYPCHAKINSARGRKPTSDTHLSIRNNLCLCKNHTAQNRIQIPLTPTQTPQTPMFSRFADLYQIISAEASAA